MNHLDAPDALREQADTQKLWEDIQAEKYRIVLSELVFAEINKCPEPKRSFMREALAEIPFDYVDQTEEAERLSKLYFEIGGLPPKSRNDAMHIAIAAANECDIILSWNFKHIVNLRAMTAVEAVNIKEGYKAIRILSPAMILEEE
jgi:predicted nucleic acid-binding protein